MPACRRFRELIDSIFFTFGTRKDAACKCGNFREAISYMHLARFASSVYHTIAPNVTVLSVVSYSQSISFFSLNNMPTYYKTVLFSLLYARSAARFEAISDG